MEYKNIIQGVFLHRPNRFIAHVLIDNTEQIAHIKNTGRFKELLIPGAVVYLEDHGDKAGRKTKYSLIAVEKGNRLVNLDSQVTNKIVGEALLSGNLKLPGFRQKITTIRPEVKYKDSRLDFYIEGISDKCFLEIKAVTLEENGIARFPDAPTERGIKHLDALVKAGSEGYCSYMIFVIQTNNIKHFEPNDATHKKFGDALRLSAQKGVKLAAYQCSTSPDSIEINSNVPIKL